MSNTPEVHDFEVEMWHIDALVPYDKNAKNHPPKQVEQIAASMTEFGFPKSKAIEVDEKGVIINGHGRRLAAIQAKMTEVPVVVRNDLSDTQIKAYRLIDNKTAESTYDTELMSMEMIDLQMDDFNLGDFFDERDLDFLTNDDLGEIDYSELDADIGSEAQAHSDATETAIEDADTKRTPISKALGFSHVVGSERRKIALFMSHVESVTGLEGAKAMVAFSQDFVGVTK